MIPETLKSIQLSDFEYHLPDSFIAQEPLIKRDESKLLVWNKGNISHHIFNQLTELLPSQTQLVINNAKVIPARLLFNKSTGGKVEVFLLEPVLPQTQMELALRVKGTSIWQCMIGNLKRWKNEETLSLNVLYNNQEITLQAKLYSREKQWVEFTWDTEASFGNVVEIAGKTPLPPYIKREAVASDLQTYQTVFASKDGAVAAPTAGLHFSNELFHALDRKGIQSTEVTLYVGAGTFAPVNAQYMADHPMHYEMISVDMDALLSLCTENIRVAVGTTSLRTLETLYWIGVKISLKEANPFMIEQFYPYSFSKIPLNWMESIGFIINHMKEIEANHFIASTSLMIMPGYRFMSVSGLITNFHYPKTTLIMLVAAFVGSDWKEIYTQAISNNYRFLSYGDSSLLWLANP